MTNGKTWKIYIEPSPKDDFILHVWADKDLDKTIASIEGIILVSVEYPTCYKVIIDHRYDVDIVRRNITAALK